MVNLLPESAKELFRKDVKGRTPAELAFKWLYDQPEVTCVLSGMNSLEMVEQNIRTASSSYAGCMTDSDKALAEQVKDEIREGKTQRTAQSLRRIRNRYLQTGKICSTAFQVMVIAANPVQLPKKQKAPV